VKAKVWEESSRRGGRWDSTRFSWIPELSGRLREPGVVPFDRAKGCAAAGRKLLLRAPADRGWEVRLPAESAPTPAGCRRSKGWWPSEDILMGLAQCGVRIAGTSLAAPGEASHGATVSRKVFVLFSLVRDNHNHRTLRRDRGAAILGARRCARRIHLWPQYPDRVRAPSCDHGVVRGGAEATEERYAQASSSASLR
jgi:hypothetical protein